ncbi:MAG TPA: GAF domain-containing protein [Albitalea sp.]|nr:GAF domain-containing protein [Albitalea sp.]
MPDLTALQRICGLLDRGEIDRAQFLARLTRHMAQHIGCSRAAVRMLIDTPRGPALRAIAMHDAAQGTSVSVPDMSSDEPQAYFMALLRDGCVVAVDALHHPATAPFVAEYLRPQDVRSLLDVGFSVNGALYGSFSCEQLAGMQSWTPYQLIQLRQIASRVSLTLMHAVTSQIDTTPGALWEPSTPNRLMTMPMPLPLADSDEPI